MNSNHLTLITSILLTGAFTAGGTYYVMTHAQPTESNAGTEPVANLPQLKPGPLSIAANPTPGQPVEITIKTEVVEKPRGKRHDFVAENEASLRRPQPHFGIFQEK